MIKRVNEMKDNLVPVLRTEAKDSFNTCISYYKDFSKKCGKFKNDEALMSQCANVVVTSYQKKINKPFSNDFTMALSKVTSLDKAIAQAIKHDNFNEFLSASNKRIELANNINKNAMLSQQHLQLVENNSHKILKSLLEVEGEIKVKVHQSFVDPDHLLKKAIQTNNKEVLQILFSDDIFGKISNKDELKRVAKKIGNKFVYYFENEIDFCYYFKHKKIKNLMK